MPAASLVQRPSHVLAGLLAAALLGWAFLIWAVVDMSHPLARLMMPMSADWGLATVAAVFVMWAIMMAAMMLPSAAPMVLIFAQLSRKGGSRAAPFVFTGAYLVMWMAFSLGAVGLHWLLQLSGLLSPMMVSTSAMLSAALLLVAGAVQLTPLKSACLTRCRSPMSFLLTEWRQGVGGAFVMGLRHGLFCVGCCWALMLLLFVGGIMNLPLVALLAVGVALEKLAPRGDRIAKGLGGVLILAGAWTGLSALA